MNRKRPEAVLRPFRLCHWAGPGPTTGLSGGGLGGRRGRTSGSLRGVTIAIAGDDGEGEDKSGQQAGDPLEVHGPRSLLGSVNGVGASAAGWSGWLDVCSDGTGSFVDSNPGGGTHSKRDTLTASAPCSIITVGVSSARRPSAPGVCGQRPQQGPCEHPVRRARDGPPPSRARGHPAFRTRSVVIRHRWSPSGARSSHGDRHISNERTRTLRCALGSGPGRERRPECPTSQSRRARLAPHRSPA